MYITEDRALINCLCLRFLVGNIWHFVLVRSRKYTSYDRSFDVTELCLRSAENDEA